MFVHLNLIFVRRLLLTPAVSASLKKCLSSVSPFSTLAEMKSFPDFKYPSVRRDESVVEDYHGTKVADPYRWLEDPDSEETKAFVDAQNAVTIPYLESCPYREKLKERLTKLWDYPKYGCPRKEGDRYFFSMNTGLQNQSVVYFQDSLKSEPKVFLDPNTLSEDGTVAIRQYSHSEDGAYYAYGICESGSDWMKIKVRDVEKLEDLSDEISKVKFSDISWTHDHKGFFYSAYLDGAGDGTETTANENHRLYYHKIGTKQSDDILVVEFSEHPKWLVIAEVSECGKYLIVKAEETIPNCMLFYCNLESLPNGITGKLPLKCIIDKFEAEYNVIVTEGNIFTVHTNKNAPNYRLVNIDITKPSEENWVDLIPENSLDVLEWATVTDEDKLVICYLRHATNVLQLHDLKTGEKIMEFPHKLGSIGACSAKKKNKELFYSYESFLSPGTIVRVEMGDEVKYDNFREVVIQGFDPEKYKTSQVFYKSKDGTEVPMFIIHHKDLVRDGSAPSFLYGYGGFQISLTPYFSISRTIFMRHLGGVAAIANIRGGNEYGQKWHDGGKLANKQNCFDDFQAAAEYLINNKYTTSKKLTINGGSNGGLLVGACINQRPDLFGCAVAQVGVMDMLRFHKFTIGYAWKSNFGCSEESKEDFDILYKYSPLHNVKIPESENVQYPAVLLTTADHDDRVVPLHSLKFIAEIQHKIAKSQKQTNPLMIRVDVKSGHGAGKPTSKRIEELVDMYCFIINSLGLKYKD